MGHKKLHCCLLLAHSVKKRCFLCIYSQKYLLKSRLLTLIYLKNTVFSLERSLTHPKVAPDLLIKAFCRVWMPEDAESFDSSVTVNPTCAYSITAWALLFPFLHHFLSFFQPEKFLYH